MDAGFMMEFKFIIKKFRELSQKERGAIFLGIKSSDHRVYVPTAFTLLKLLTDNSKEMAVDQRCFDDWLVFPEDAPNKAAAIWKYFKENLRDSVDGIVIPDPR